jgi:hypothetical protein
LVQKLGIKPTTILRLVNAPPALAKKLSAAGATAKGKADVAVIFATEGADLDRQFHKEVKRINPDGAIWCAWPKKASKVPTDITEDLLRELFLPTGMVDNKVCAIDEKWSGLRFVVRKELRSTWTGD